MNNTKTESLSCIAVFSSCWGYVTEDEAASLNILAKTEQSIKLERFEFEIAVQFGRFQSSAVL